MITHKNAKNANLAILSIFILLFAQNLLIFVVAIGI